MAVMTEQVACPTTEVRMGKLAAEPTSSAWSWTLAGTVTDGLLLESRTVRFVPGLATKTLPFTEVPPTAEVGSNERPTVLDPGATMRVGSSPAEVGSNERPPADEDEDGG